MNTLSTPMQQVVARVGYPFTMLSSLVLHYLLMAGGISPSLAAIYTILWGAFLVTLLEYYIPYRRKWQPSITDFATDATYMITVQLVLPRAVSFLIAVGILSFLETRGLTLDFLWPHGLPVYLQAILMLLLADFGRYWLHRANHRFLPLWRLHAVHHSPPKLYWVNTGRFHPIEKTFQLLVDTAPFLIVGVPAEVLAIYFVFYAVNGFFQHCNINVRLGPLNYVVSGPELHRWHHSKRLDESIRNLGSNLIVWDLLFGTWYLPKDREVAELGVTEKDYPLDFLHQQSAPFTHRGY